MFLSVDHLDHAADIWATYVVAAMWQASVVAAIALLLTRLKSRWPAPLRVAILLVAMVKFLIPPMMTMPTGIFRFAPPAVAVQTATPVAHDEMISITPAAKPETLAPQDLTAEASPLRESAPAVHTAIPQVSPTPLSRNAWLMCVHAAGTLLIGGWIIAGMWRLLLIARRAGRVTDGPLYDRWTNLLDRLHINLRIDLLLSDDPLPPMAFGIFRRQIMLPRAIVEKLSEAQLNAILAHELAHHQRRDAFVTFLQLLTLAAWWFNPLTWLICAELRRTREECCDDIVIGESIADGQDYCHTMLAAAEQLSAAVPAGAMFAMAEPMHPLGQRMKRIMDPALKRMSRLPKPWLAAVLILAALVLPGVRRISHNTSNAATTTATTAPTNTTPTTTTQPTGNNHLAGIVTKQDGSPLADAQVYLLRRGTYIGKPHSQQTRSSADGSFSFDGLAAGGYRIWAVEGNLTSRETIFGDIIKVPQPAAAAGSLKLVMRPGRTLNLVVTSIDAKPIANAKVSLGFSYLSDDIKTDANGKISIPALPPEMTQVSVSASNKAKVTKNVNLATALEMSLEFSLPEGGSVSGRVLDPEGKPVASAGVNAYPGNEGTPLAYVEAAADGSYKIDNLPLDLKIRILVTDKTYSNHWDSIDLSSAQPDRTLDMKLDPKPPGGSIEGTVVDADGKPLPGATLTCYDRGSDGDHRVAADASGHFRIDNIVTDGTLPPQFSARAKGWAPKLISLNPGTPQVPATTTIQMTEKGHTIAGRVVDEQHQPVKGAEVYAGGEYFPQYMGGQTTTDSQGRFHFDSLPDRIDFAFVANGFSEQKTRPELDGAEPIEIVMQAMGAVNGRVVDADSNQPIPKFNIRLRASPRHKPGDPYPGIESGRGKLGEEFADGAFRLDNLTAGAAITLVVTADGYPVQYFDDANATPGGKGEPTLIHLSKHPADLIRVAGVIADQAGKPLAGLDVRAVVYGSAADSHRPEALRFDWGMLKSGQLSYQPYIRSIESAKTGADGSFAFDDVKGGDVDLAYWGQGIANTRVPAVGKLPADQREHLKLSPPGAGSIAGRINRKAYPQVTGFSLNSVTDPTFRLEIPANDGQENYKTDPIPAGRYKLFLDGAMVHDTLIPQAFFAPRDAVRTIEVKAGVAASADFGFGQRTISGIVTQEGKPLAGCNVAIYLADEPVDVVRVASTGSAGAYRFEFVDAAKYQIIALGQSQPDEFRTRQRSEVQNIDASEHDVVEDMSYVAPAAR